MAHATISSRGQVALPADIRQRLGLLAGTQVELVEQPDGVKLAVPLSARTVALATCAGVVTAASKGKPRRLEDFDPATLISQVGK